MVPGWGVRLALVEPHPHHAPLEDPLSRRTLIMFLQANSGRKERRSFRVRSMPSILASSVLPDLPPLSFLANQSSTTHDPALGVKLALVYPRPDHAPLEDPLSSTLSSSALPSNFFLLFHSVATLTSGRSTANQEVIVHGSAGVAALQHACGIQFQFAFLPNSTDSSLTLTSLLA